MSAKTPDELRADRLRQRRPITGNEHITVAALWPKKGENLGTLLRTMDAIGGVLVVPATANATRALTKGNTIGMNNSPFIATPYHPMEYLHAQAMAGRRIIGVELAHDSIELRDVKPAYEPTVVVLGHEANGIPKEAFQFFTEVVEIPMSGVGSSLNVAVAGSLVAYKLAGMI